MELFAQTVPQTGKIVELEKESNVSGGGINRNHIFEQIISLKNLFGAWRDFSKGKRNRADVQAFGTHLEDYLFRLHAQLRDGVWTHGSYERLHVCDPKPRSIHKASVADRIVHHAVVRVIEPIIDRSFIYDTWSCRAGKGTHGAVARLQHELRRTSCNGAQRVWILKCDIKKYFEHVDQMILLRTIGRFIGDARAMQLIKRIVASFNPGLPLGNLTSQLFANFYLSSFDHFVKEQLQSRVYLRYCDDFALAHTSRARLLARLPYMQRFLTQRLHLTLHPYKIVLRPFHYGLDWLGYVLYPDHCILRPATHARMWKQVRVRLNEYGAGQRSYSSLRSTLASYDGLLAHSWNDYDRRLLGELWRCG